MAKAGMKPGQVNGGSFKKGHDSRRMTPITFRNGQAFREVCREKSSEAFDFIYNRMNDAEEDGKLRVYCAKYIIEQGYGKPLTSLAVSTDDGDVTKMKAGQIDALIARHLGANIIEHETIDQEGPAMARSETIEPE